MAGRLEESKLAVLSTVVKATDAKVVLSTDWRRQAQLKRQVIATLKRLDIEVIGATPMRAMFQPIRPQEITEWMHANGEKFGVSSWVAIDDRDLLNEQGGAELQGHMIRTHPNTGLTKRLGDAAIEILNGGAPPGSPDTAMDLTLSKEQRNGRGGLSATGPPRAKSPARGGLSAPKAQPAVPTSFATSAALASTAPASTSSATNPSASGTSSFGGAACTKAIAGLRGPSPPPAARSSTPRTAAAEARLSPGARKPTGPGTPSTSGTSRVGRAGAGASPAKRAIPLEG